MSASPSEVYLVCGGFMSLRHTFALGSMPSSSDALSGREPADEDHLAAGAALGQEPVLGAGTNCRCSSKIGPGLRQAERQGTQRSATRQAPSPGSLNPEGDTANALRINGRAGPPPRAGN